MNNCCSDRIIINVFVVMIRKNYYFLIGWIKLWNWNCEILFQYILLWLVEFFEAEYHLVWASIDAKLNIDKRQNFRLALKFRALHGSPMGDPFKNRSQESLEKNSWVPIAMLWLWFLDDSLLITATVKFFMLYNVEKNERKIWFLSIQIFIFFLKTKLISKKKIDLKLQFQIVSKIN
jgi:hypothetical protein